jgi:hypothetical protein
VTYCSSTANILPDAKRAPAPDCKLATPHVPFIIESFQEIEKDSSDMRADASVNSLGEREQQCNNIVYLPFVTPELLTCAKSCGLTPEAYISKVLAFANAAVKNEEHRRIVFGAGRLG